MSEKKSVFRQQYDEALEKFEQIHEAHGGAFEEYVQFSKFIYGIFIKNKDVVITRKNFRDANMELMCHIKNKVEKHPWIFRRMFMIK